MLEEEITVVTRLGVPEVSDDFLCELLSFFDELRGSEDALGAEESQRPEWIFMGRVVC